MQVKYIGKGHKKDSITGVGLHWHPGQEREVTSTVAAHLLSYPDTWVKGDEECDKHVSVSQKETKVEAGDKPEPIGYLEKDRHPDEPLPVVNFHAMDKNSLINYAQTHYNEKFDKRQSEDVIRERVIKLHSKHEMEDRLP